MIYTRAQFADMWNEEKPGMGDADSPLWVPEDSTNNIRCEWFVCIRPLGVQHFKKQYWAWCDENLVGTCRCFSSSVEGPEEWWGFTNEDDIALWMLKWM